MTLTVELRSDAERRLHEKSIQQGEAVGAVAAEIVAEPLEWEAQETGEAVEGIRRGLEVFEFGQCRPFEEFADEQRRKHQLSGAGSSRPA